MEGLKLGLHATINRDNSWKILSDSKKSVERVHIFTNQIEFFKMVDRIGPINRNL